MCPPEEDGGLVPKDPSRDVISIFARLRGMNTTEYRKNKRGDSHTPALVPNVVRDLASARIDMYGFI